MKEVIETVNVGFSELTSSVMRCGKVLCYHSIMTIIVWYYFYMLWCGSLTRRNSQLQNEVKWMHSCLGLLTSVQFKMMLFQSKLHPQSAIIPAAVGQQAFFVVVPRCTLAWAHSPQFSSKWPRLSFSYL